MSNTPLVSVVISTFNRCRKLQRAIESVRRQTFADFEIIVVDDASSDDTAAAVSAISDGRLRFFRHAYNMGGPAARNTAIRQSRGAYIALLDDDDEWLAQKLEQQVHLMERTPSQTGVIYTGSIIVNEHTGAVIARNHPQYRGRIYQRLLLSTVIGSVSSALVRRECFDRVGLFDEQLTSCQDWDMWLRIAAEYDFDFVAELLTKINQHGVQISTNYAALIPGRTRMVEKHRDEFARYPSIFVVHLKRLGKLHMINGTWREGWSWFAQAIRLNPLEIFKILAWCMLELPYTKIFLPARRFKKYRAAS